MFARGLVGMSARHWLVHILLPVAGVVAVCLAAGCLPRLWMDPSFGRVVATGAVCETAFFALTWGVLLDAREKTLVLGRLSKLRDRMAGRGEG